MKKITLLLSAAVFICGYLSINAQSTDTIKNIKRCATVEHIELQKKSDPTLESRIQALEASTQQWIKNNRDQLENTRTVNTIPIVVHVVGTSVSSSITDARIQEQIDVLNRDYAGLNTHSMAPFSTSLKANTEIQFCLAKRDPSGNGTSGIERRTTGASTSFTLPTNNMKHYSTGGLDQWSPQKYMNIWVCNLTGGSAGFAEPPANPLPSTFGVVIDYTYFGITGATPPLNGGATTSHELAHCFNLYHIWGNGSNCSTDYCADTPPQAAPTTGAPSGTRTDACSPNPPGIMYMNFMDYTDDIKMANFTPNQKTRMKAMFATGQSLNPLSTSNACTPPAGVEENENIQNINIYPSPTSGKVNINFSIINPCDVTVSVHNIIGAEIYSFNKNKASTVNSDIDISSQSSGIYFVKIKTENQVVTQKIILVK